IGGWRDGYMNWPLRTFVNLEVPKKVLIGPWTHTLPDLAQPGPNIDYLNETARWFAYWLRGEATGIMDEPPVSVYVMEYQYPTAAPRVVAGKWRNEASFPSAAGTSRTLYLRSGGILADEPAGEVAEAFDEYVYRPTIGTTRALWAWLLPVDQRADEGFGP